MRTKVTKMLGIDFPIFAFTHCRDVAAAVTNAGGFGVLGAVAHSPQQLDVDLKWIAEQTKGRPLGVDTKSSTRWRRPRCSPPAASPAGGRWRRRWHSGRRASGAARCG